MACYKPLYGYYIPGAETNTGAQKYYVRKTECITFETDDRYQRILIPCGKCIGCQLQYARQWAIRCVLEAREHEYNYFVTLTYNENNVPKTDVVNNLGDVSFVKTLRKKDLQDFNKLLRQHYKRHYNHEGIRFYACGEYGENSLRPHYHIIYFNLPIDDLVFYKKTKDGKSLWISKTLNDIWKKGYVVVGEVNEKTASYVARYVNKKLGKDVDLPDEMEREFTLCSRRPGIARNYFEAHKGDIYLTDTLYYDGQKYKPPRYYDKLLGAEDEVKLADVRNTRQLHRQLDDMLLDIKDDKKYLRNCEESKKKSAKSLKRCNIPIDKTLEMCYAKIVERNCSPHT